MPTIWKPATYGEELFLTLHAGLCANMQISSPTSPNMDFLVSPVDFCNFTSLSATSEVFLRCVRTTADLYRREPSAQSARFAQTTRRELDLPLRLLENQKLGELLKHVGRVVVERHRDKSLEASATRQEPDRCYLCDAQLTNAGTSMRTIEHVWPISLGGETVEQNLVLACQDCNSKRGNMMTWAHGPVHSTYYTHSSGNPKNPPGDLRLSLALARLLLAAAPTRTRRSALTLKEAIKAIRPAVPRLAFEADRPYVYFELLQQVRESV
jgi:hypothetical protein